MSLNEINIVDALARTTASDHSPCVGHCTYDAQDYCLSCRRHTDEIGQWRDAEDGLRQAAWDRIPAEIDAMGLETMRLPLSPDDIITIAIETLDQGGSWAVGAKGCYAYGHDLLSEEDGVLRAADAEGRAEVTLDLSGKMRAVAWTRGASTGRKLADGIGGLPLLLVVPRVRLTLPIHDTPTVLEDGMTDCGLGLAHCQMMTAGDDLYINTMLARAKMPRSKHGLADDGFADGGFDGPDLPQGLVLPESYALAAVILPKGEALL